MRAGADEEGALERLKALRRDLVDSKVVEHHGGVPGARPGTKTTGDGLRVGFFGPSMRCFRCRLVRQRRCKIQLSGDRSQAPVVRP
jgi:hypothetical protein